MNKISFLKFSVKYFVFSLFIIIQACSTYDIKKEAPIEDKSPTESEILDKEKYEDTEKSQEKKTKKIVRHRENKKYSWFKLKNNKSKYIPVNWSSLPNLEKENFILFKTALVNNCKVVSKRKEWVEICNDINHIKEKNIKKIISFLKNNFNPYQIQNLNGEIAGVLTGYYEPILEGSRNKTNKFKFPVYKTPSDLLTLDLSSLYTELRGKRIRGRIKEKKVIPYYSRKELEILKPATLSETIAWIENEIDLFFLHIQGSGQIKLKNGKTIKVGYDNHNGHPYVSIGKILIEDKELKKNQASMQNIKKWAKKNPTKVKNYLHRNPSFVFFRELSSSLSGPIGAMGVPLTSKRSIAVDPMSIPLGYPLYISTSNPINKNKLNTFTFTQDTGGAIKGSLRGDFFWGSGPTAGSFAGKMKNKVEMWILLPKKILIKN